MINGNDIKGIKGLLAFKALHTLLFGYYVLPEYRKKDETYKDFLQRFANISEEEKREILNIGLYFTGIPQQEIIDLICFCRDKNGIPYSAANVNNLTIDELFRLIVEVCLEV